MQAVAINQRCRIAGKRGVDVDERHAFRRRERSQLTVVLIDEPGAAAPARTARERILRRKAREKDSKPAAPGVAHHELDRADSRTNLPRIAVDQVVGAIHQQQRLVAAAGENSRQTGPTLRRRFTALALIAH